MMPVTVHIRRGTERFAEREPGRLTRHSFAFGAAYDPENLRFGPMVCHDDHLLADGKGFDAHRHSGLVIVSYVVSGVLAHTDADGTREVRPGQLAVLRTGDGAEHAEHAAAPQTRFVQMWFADDEPAGAAPTYEVLDAAEVRPHPDVVLTVHQLDAGEALALPAAPLLHAYVARGALLRSSLAEPLAEGDAFRFTDEPPHEVVAGVPSTLLVAALGQCG